MEGFNSMSEQEQEDFIDLNLGILLTPDILARVKGACEAAYALGDKAGYDRAYRSAISIIGILCKREDDNTIIIHDHEIKALCNKGSVTKTRLEKEQVTHFSYKETQ